MMCRLDRMTLCTREEENNIPFHLISTPLYGIQIAVSYWKLNRKVELETFLTI